MGLTVSRFHNRSEGFQMIQLAGISALVGTPTVTVLELDSSGNVTRAKGATLPTDADVGYAKGCEFVKTDGGVGSSIYKNEGDETSADFNVIANSSSDPVTIYNDIGSTLAAGTLVNVSSFSGTDGLTVVKADADAGIVATHVVKDAILSTASGIVYPIAVVTDLNTNGTTIGDPVYLSATAGSFTFTAPTDVDQVKQKVGTVKIVNATTGAIDFFPGTHQVQKIASSMVQDSAGASGLSLVKRALMVYDFSVDGGSQGAISPSGAPTIPDNAVVWLESYDVITTLQSSSDAATVKVGFATDGDISTAIAISDASNPWDAGAFSRIAGGLATPLTKKLTGARAPIMTVAGGEDLTAGKVVFQLAYWVSQ